MVCAPGCPSRQPPLQDVVGSGPPRAPWEILRALVHASMITYRPCLALLLVSSALPRDPWRAEVKFAVGSGEKLVPVCYFEDQNNFWVSKHMRKHKSTVLCVAWAPGAAMLATGGADSKARVLSAYVKGVDAANKQTPFGSDPQFGSLLAEFDCGGWVHAVAWHPNGSTVGFASHDSVISVANLTAPGTPPQRIRLRELPMKALTFLPSGALVGVGFSYTPLIFAQVAGTSTYTQGTPMQKVASETSSATVSGVSAARRMFQAQDKARQEQTVNQAARLNTVHQNCVTCVRLFDARVGGTVAEFTTSGLDGRIAFWTSDELSAAMRALSVSGGGGGGVVNKPAHRDAPTPSM
mmetsp:Transcript_10955/g.32537  ORF Transcript_10955/g.32537 Transcript_10955/m.32537 type:complete len:352 (+) Transcript_10955:393-1448(+)